MTLLDWPSRALLALTSAVVAFAVTGMATGGLHATQVALAEPTPTTNPSMQATPTPDPVGETPAVTAVPTPTPTPTPPPPVTIAFAGDVHGEPPIENVLVDGGNPLADMAEVLSAADLAVVNLETAVGTTGVAADKTYTFQADPSLADALAEAGVDVVSLANNHALDYGYEAAEETMAVVSAAGLAPIGYGDDEDEAYSPHVVDVEGRTVALLGISRVLPTISWEAVGDRAGMASAYDPDRAVRAVSEAAGQADHVVVFMHWGQERHVCPNANQMQLARRFADAGADVVVGAHPHVLQGIERVGDTLVAYSLGNFVFYASRASQRQTGVLTVTLTDDGATSHTWSPAYIDGHGSPQPVAEQEHIPAETGTVDTGEAACGPPTSGG